MAGVVGVRIVPLGCRPDSVEEAAGRTQTQAPLAGSLGALKGVVPRHAERPPGFQRPFPAAPPTKGGWGGRVAGAEIGRQGAACGRGRRRRPAPPRLAWASVCDPNLGVLGLERDPHTHPCWGRWESQAPRGAGCGGTPCPL